MSKQIPRAYKFRLYPNIDQQIFFAKSFGCTRFICNRMLVDKKAYYNLHKKSLENTLAQYKTEFEWLRVIDSLALANVQLQLHQAFQHFFKRPDIEFPTFKHKGKKDTYTTNNQKGTVSIGEGSIKLPKVGYIKANIHRPINGLVNSATISKTAIGKYDVSILIETIAKPFLTTNSNIGIDLGLTDVIVLSDGTKVANPKFLAKLQDKLARVQKMMSKRS